MRPPWCDPDRAGMAEQRLADMLEEHPEAEAELRALGNAWQGNNLVYRR